MQISHAISTFVAETLTRRAREVLYALLTEFISNGEPVGSRTLVRKYRFNLSPATIRNVLADLEDLGYLVQPHTSAGRVPTEKAFRLFVSALMKTRQLSGPEAAKIEDWLRQEPTSNDTDLLRSTGRLLSELTGSPALVARRSAETRRLLKIQFIPTRPSELLGVMVFGDGTVENRFIHIDTPLETGELDRVHQLLEEVAQGLTLTELRNHFASVRETSHDNSQPLNSRGLSLLSATISRAPRATELVVEGQSRVLDQASWAQGEQIKGLLHTLEDRDRLIQLLDRTLESNNVQVFLGEDIGGTTESPLSLVAAPYQNQTGEPGGAVGVIGPTRMDYSVVVPLVSATADAFARALLKAGQHSTAVGPQETDPGAHGLPDGTKT